MSTLNVADVEQLYCAVNNSAHEGAAIILAPGTYVLSATDGGGVARPNGGRLELQRDMSLYGVMGDRSAVVIDATGLPAESVNLPQPPLQPTNRTAPVRIGRGNNTIEWLTVLGNTDSAAGIATDLEGTANTQIRVAHVISSGAPRGVDVRNTSPANAGRRIDADIVENEFIGPTQVTAAVNGIRLANFPGADGGVVVAAMSGNRTHGYQMGCLVGNNRASNATVQVRSSGDRFFANALGCLVMGGTTGANAGNASSNSTSFEAHGSQFVDNGASIAGTQPGGIRVIGGTPKPPNVASNNTVFAALWGSKVSGNLGVDFEAFGAPADAGAAATNNHVTIELHGVSESIEVLTPPADSNNTNTVTVIR